MRVIDSGQDAAELDEPSQLAGGFGQLPDAAIFAGYAAWLIAGLCVIAWRYRRVEVAQ